MPQRTDLTHSPVPGGKEFVMMSLREDIVYRYDGTLDGMLNCIFESYARHEMPAAILPSHEPQGSLFETRAVPSEPEKADRVLHGIRRVAGELAEDLTRLSHLTCLPERELVALRFVRLAMKTGPSVCSQLADYRVNTICRAVNYLQTESHHLAGFLRFSEAEDGTLVSLISPRNDVLPLLDAHFSDRLPEERFIIYDRTRQKALMHLPGVSRTVSVNELKMPAIRREELDVQMLWRRFHQTIAVEGRVNPTLQRSMLPLRFRPDMTEFQPTATYREALPT